MKIITSNKFYKSLFARDIKSQTNVQYGSNVCYDRITKGLFYLPKENFDSVRGVKFSENRTG